MFLDHKQELGESLLGMAEGLPGVPPAPLFPALQTWGILSPEAPSLHPPLRVRAELKLSLRNRNLVQLSPTHPLLPTP